MVTIHAVKQGSDEWHALRSGRYTGANAWKLLTYGAGGSALTEQSSFGGNYWTRRGHVLEDESIELYETIRQRHVDRPGFITNDRFPACGFSPDGLSGEILIECKAFATPKHLSIYRGDVPFAVMAQIQFGLMICEKPVANLLIYNPELEPKLAFKILEIRANRKIANNFARILGKEAHATATA